MVVVLVVVLVVVVPMSAILEGLILLEEFMICTTEEDLGGFQGLIFIFTQNLV